MGEWSLNRSFLKKACWIGIAFLLVSPAFSKVLSSKGKALFKPDEILVKFEDDAEDADKDRVFSTGKDHVAATTANYFSSFHNLYKVHLTPGSDVLKTVDSLKGMKGVHYVQPNYLYYATGVCGSTPVSGTSDQYYAAPYWWPLTIIQAPQAWALSSWTSCPGSGVKVAVLDTGISRYNPDLRNVPFIGYNAICATGEQDSSCGTCSATVTETTSTTTMDDFGHGTWVSGIIAAEWNGGTLVSETSETGDCNSSNLSGGTGSTTGMAGLAGGAVIMPVKVLDCTGSGASDAIGAGIEYAVSKGARVINLSLGGPSDPTEESIIEEAISDGCVVVAAAGNDSDLPNSLVDLEYPAGYPGVIAVGATDQNDKIAYYSNGGSGADGKLLDLVAPGGYDAPNPSASITVNAQDCIFSTMLCSLPTTVAEEGSFQVSTVDGNYGVAAGTSGATPYVSAAAALLLSMNPSWSPLQVEQQLDNNTDSLNGNGGWSTQTGYGRLNVYKALVNAQGAGQVTSYVKTFNSPNPYYPDLGGYTNITLVMTRPQAVQLSIYDTAGELVLNRNYGAGQLNSNSTNPQFQSYYVSWDGRNGSGQMVKTGVYFYAVNVGGSVSRNKIVVIRGPQ